MSTELIQESMFGEDRVAFIPSECRYPTFYQLYLKLRSLRWTEAGFNTNDDKLQWEKDINKDERFFIEMILGFFSGSDILVMKNLEERMLPEIDILEAQLFYAEQMQNEVVHTITYGKLLEGFVDDTERRRELSNAIVKIESIKRKADWARKWTRENSTLGERLIAYVVIEGIFFSGAFCSIFWLKNRGLMLHALCKSNDWISRDEGIHVEFGIEQYRVYTQKGFIEAVSQERAHEIIKEAMDIETQFICDSLPCRLIGMNNESMTQYVQFTADFVLQEFGFERLYNSENPFSFSHMQGMESKTNFFETENTSYQQANAMTTKSEEVEFRLDADV